MVQSNATTPAAYVAGLPADRRADIQRVRALVNAHLPKGYDEVMQYGMISWIVPSTRLAQTYNGQPLAIASLAAQKQYASLYLMGVYGHEPTKRAFEAAYQRSGKKLDLGKSCLRFKSYDDLAEDAVAAAIAAVDVEAFVTHDEQVKGGAPAKTKAAPATSKAAAKKTKAARAR